MLEFSGAALSDLWLNFVKWFNCLTLSVQLAVIQRGILEYVEYYNIYYIIYIYFIYMYYIQSVI